MVINNDSKQIEAIRNDELDSKNLEEVSEIMEHTLTKNSIDSINWKAEYPYHPITAFSIAYSCNYVYVYFYVHGNYLRAVNYTNNSPVSEDSCVEFFMSLPNSKTYWNFEFNCIGTINASHRITRDNPTRLNDEQLSTIKRYASCGTRPFEEMEGLFGWTLTIAIPTKLIGLDIEKTNSFKANFYKCGSKTGLPHFISWNPIISEKPNFHCPECFGEVILK